MMAAFNLRASVNIILALVQHCAEEILILHFVWVCGFHSSVGFWDNSYFYIFEKFKLLNIYFNAVWNVEECSSFLKKFLSVLGLWCCGEMGYALAVVCGLFIVVACLVEHKL